MFIKYSCFPCFLYIDFNFQMHWHEFSYCRLLSMASCKLKSLCNNWPLLIILLLQFGGHATMPFTFIASWNGWIHRLLKHIVQCAVGNGSSKNKEVNFQGLILLNFIPEFQFSAVCHNLSVLLKNLSCTLRELCCKTGVK